MTEDLSWICLISLAVLVILHSLLLMGIIAKIQGGSRQEGAGTRSSPPIGELAPPLEGITGIGVPSPARRGPAPPVSFSSSPPIARRAGSLWRDGMRKGRNG
jgi:hypothetical protein